MSTWHQDNAMRRDGVRLWHETKWTHVDDQPGRHMSIERFDTYAEAMTAIERKGGYILAPARIGARDDNKQG
ncbi:hypothetical protein [Cupriavidus metallidurans]|uniref:hypothetical protein n=1 Tax=Cupriavidus metallidurans TaxID=119219 RepID=UPI001CCBAB57|nr:hypothetical protein [Cupriavidus metallidurans]UBM12802.1 hypothetical protein LAI70_28015 [Cupriavidus metallidurans]